MIGAVDTLTGDVGGAVGPNGVGNINILGGKTTIPTGVININTRGTPGSNLMEINLNDDVTLLGFLFAGAYVGVGATVSEFVGTFVLDGNSFAHAFGTNNTFLGNESGNFTLSGTTNVGIGSGALFNLASGSANTCIGFTSGGNINSGSSNTGIGDDSLDAVTSGDHNVAIGASALDSITSTDYNIGIGSGTFGGTALTGTSNICIGNAGVGAENNTIRIGTEGVGDGQQDTTFIAGIYGVTPVGATETVIIDSNGQLGSAPGSSGFTWNEETGTSASMAVSNGYISNNAGLVTLTLPAVAVIGDVVRVTGKGSGGWRIAQNAGQTIYFGVSTTTTGVTGRLDSTATRDGIELLCITANNDWNVLSSIGNITVT
jgi:hypothetical protein